MINPVLQLCVYSGFMLNIMGNLILENTLERERERERERRFIVLGIFYVKILEKG